MRRIWFLSLVLIGCANSKDSCGHRALLPWPDKNGVYGLREVQIQSLSSLYEVRGSAAEVYVENSLTRFGYLGRVARPNLTRSGDTCVPMDARSSLALAAYAQYERLRDFDRALGIDGQISWPRKVGLEIQLQGPPVMIHNNAHYYGDLDLTAVVPYTLPELPVALNHGILAHEHFHAHFQSQVLDRLKWARPVVTSVEALFYGPSLQFTSTPVDPFGRGPRTDPGVLNPMVLRAWNEGLADVYAGLYTGDAQFFNSSMRARNRDLESPLAPLRTGAELAGNVRRMLEHKYSNSMIDKALVDGAYDDGAVFARLMYKLAYSGMVSPEDFEMHVAKKLAELPSRISARISEEVLDMESILPVLLAGLELNSGACAHLRKSAVSQSVLTKGLRCPVD